MQFRVIVEPDEDGVFVAEVPELPGCISQGRTLAEARANIKDAIGGYLDSLKAHGEPLPGARCLVESVEDEIDQNLFALEGREEEEAASKQRIEEMVEVER